jgi:hypothetical protein
MRYGECDAAKAAEGVALDALRCPTRGRTTLYEGSGSFSNEMRLPCDDKDRASRDGPLWRTG